MSDYEDNLSGQTMGGEGNEDCFKKSLGEGECPACGTLNPPSGKFCVDCSAKLQVPCLQCHHPVQIWNKACGECGTQQHTLVQARLEELQSYHDAAEQHLNSFEFDEAAKAAAEIGVQEDPRLLQFAAWHKEFTTRLEATRDSEYRRLTELLTEANAHEQAHDYSAGLRTLSQVSAALLGTTVTGIPHTANELLNRLSDKQDRVKELEAVIRASVNQRELAGLISYVNELQELKPNRPEVLALKEKLERRRVSLLKARDLASE